MTCWRQDNSAILYKNKVATLHTHPLYIAKRVLTYSTSASTEKLVSGHYTDVKEIKKSLS